MTGLKKIIAVCVCFLLFTSSLCAGTKYSGHVEGYSSNGRYALLSISGIEDGSGYYFINLRILDVFKNRFVGGKISFRQENDEENTEDIDKTAFRRAKNNLRKYGINRSLKGQNVKLNGAGLVKRFTCNQREHIISLSEISTTHKCGSMAGPIEAKGFSISLDNRVLDRVSSGKDCAFGYSIQGAVVFMDHVIIIYSAETPGFEGPDSRAMFSSGSLK